MTTELSPDNEALARLILYVLARIDQSESGPWLFRMKASTNQPPSKEMRDRGAVLGYEWEVAHSCWVHGAEPPTGRPAIGEYWSGGSLWSLQTDVNGLRTRLGLPGVSLRSAGEASGGDTFRSNDRWLLRSVSRDKPIDDWLRSVLRDGTSLAGSSNKSIHAWLAEVVDALLGMDSPRSWKSESSLSGLLRTQEAKASDPHEIHDLRLILQPLLALADLRVTSHGVAKPFAMYDADSVESYLADVGRMIRDLELIGVSGALAYGAVLGVVRESRLMPHDMDLDVMIASPGTDSDSYPSWRASVVDHLKRRGWLVSEYVSNGWLGNFNVCARDYGYYIGRPFVGSIDVFPFRNTADPSSMEFYFTRQPLAWGDVFPTVWIASEVGHLPLPANPTAYLDKQYGPSWRRVRTFANAEMAEDD